MCRIELCSLCLLLFLIALASSILLSIDRHNLHAINFTCVAHINTIVYGRTKIKQFIKIKFTCTIIISLNYFTMQPTEHTPVEHLL